MPAPLALVLRARHEKLHARLPLVRLPQPLIALLPLVHAWKLRVLILQVLHVLLAMRHVLLQVVPAV